jgi:hypothetical protein
MASGDKLLLSAHPSLKSDTLLFECTADLILRLLSGRKPWLQELQATASGGLEIRLFRSRHPRVQQEMRNGVWRGL